MSSNDGMSLLRGGSETPPPSLESHSSSDLQLHHTSSGSSGLGPPPSYEVMKVTVYILYNILTTFVGIAGIGTSFPPISQCGEGGLPAQRRGAGENCQADGTHPAPPHGHL